MTEFEGHEDRLEISADSSVFVWSREEGLHGRSRVGGSAPALCQRAGCYQSHPWDLHPAPGIRHRGRDLGEVVSFGQKPDRLTVPCRGHVRAGPVLLLQSQNAQVIRHMRHGSSPRLLALQPIRVPDPGESPADSISRSPYEHPLRSPGSGIADLLGKLPAVLAFRRAQQALQVQASLPSWLSPDEQLTQPHLQRTQLLTPGKDACRVCRHGSPPRSHPRDSWSHSPPNSTVELERNDACFTPRWE